MEGSGALWNHILRVVPSICKHNINIVFQLGLMLYLNQVHDIVSVLQVGEGEGWSTQLDASNSEM